MLSQGNLKKIAHALMIRLYHIAISPACRKIRLVLAEKRVEADLVDEYPWEQRSDFLALNPAGKVPVLRDDQLIIAESPAIFEYLEEKHPSPALLPRNLAERAEARRLEGYFDDKFYNEVSRPLLNERVYTRLSKEGAPDSAAIKSALKAIKFHYGYMEWLLEDRRWLAGDVMTIADFTAAAHFSSLDYINDVDWGIIPNVKDWYAKIKSRPAFRPILQDLIPGLRPPKQYSDLDF